MSFGDDVSHAVHGMRAVRESAHEQLLRERARRHTSKTRKSVATRERIMAAATALMAEHGGTGFQMGEVSERAHMSKGALYYYFADKDELVDAIFAEAVDDVIASMERVVATAPTARVALRGLCLEFARRVRGGSPLALALTSELAGTHGGALGTAATNLSHAIAIVASQLERAKAEGIVRANVNVALAATYVVGGYLMTSVGAASHGLVDNDDMVDELMAVTLGGIGVPGLSVDA